mgnify:CR=1 FL=1
MTKNDITGDKLISKDNYRDNYDAIFSKKEKSKTHWWYFIFVPLLTYELVADEIKFGFKSPSFSGNGTSSHYLTIDSQEQTKKDALAAEIKALADAAKRAEENNLITWTSDGISITMTIFNEATGETTTITIPIGDFGF